MKYLSLVIFLSLIVTAVIMKFIRQGSQSLLIDFIIYVVVAGILTIILIVVNPTVRELLFHK